MTAPRTCEHSRNGATRPSISLRGVQASSPSATTSQRRDVAAFSVNVATLQRRSEVKRESGGECDSEEKRGREGRCESEGKRASGLKRGSEGKRESGAERWK